MNARKVYLFDSLGEQIADYPSAMDCARALGIFNLSGALRRGSVIGGQYYVSYTPTITVPAHTAYGKNLAANLRYTGKRPAGRGEDLEYPKEVNYEHYLGLCLLQDPDHSFDSYLYRSVPTRAEQPDSLFPSPELCNTK